MIVIIFVFPERSQTETLYNSQWWGPDEKAGGLSCFSLHLLRLRVASRTYYSELKKVHHGGGAKKQTPPTCPETVGIEGQKYGLELKWDSSILPEERETTSHSGINLKLSNGEVEMTSSWFLLWQHGWELVVKTLGSSILVPLVRTTQHYTPIQQRLSQLRCWWKNLYTSQLPTECFPYPKKTELVLLSFAGKKRKKEKKLKSWEGKGCAQSPTKQTTD